MRTFAALIFACLFAVPGFAKDSEPRYPVAVRWWGQGMVSIETYWNHTVVIDPDKDALENLSSLSPDLVLFTEQAAYKTNNVARRINAKIDGNLFREHLLHRISQLTYGQHIGRIPNRSRLLSEMVGTRDKPALEDVPHQIIARSYSTKAEDQPKSPLESEVLISVEVDGVRFLHCGNYSHSKLNDSQLKLIGKVDVLAIPIAGMQTWNIVRQLKPRILLPIHYNVEQLEHPQKLLDDFLGNAPEHWTILKRDHNTFAYSAKLASNPLKGCIVIVPGSQPWQPKGELATLLEKMDASCQASQKVFAPLSVDQMNWRPPNGTHTPRWNSEHMMGRQLGFFSQIYSAMDSQTFDHIDLNPAQMPPDYQAAHPDWSGAEEARQMQRANAYVRRFAYLLEGVDLDKRAPGSRWTLRGLLKQMDRHYGEHTANVVKKFELEDWPAE